jgi:hypothetical protein
VNSFHKHCSGKKLKKPRRKEMNRIVKTLAFVTAVFLAFTVYFSFAEAAQEETLMIDEKNLVIMPCKYVGKRIVTEALYLDTSENLLNDMFNDMKTRFDSRYYLNFRTIDNAVMRYFIHLKKADIIPTLDEGDKIIITGVVTSCADGKAWVDVDSVIRAPKD